MTEPLALIFYDHLLPGSQVTNKLKQLSWRVNILKDPEAIIPAAQNEKPLLLLMDLDTPRGTLLSVVENIKKDPTTAHIPILAFVGVHSPAAEQEAIKAGVDLVVADEAILGHLPQLLDQVLEVK